MRKRLENLALPVGRGPARLWTIFWGGSAVLTTFVMVLRTVRGDFDLLFYLNVLYAVVSWLTFLRYLGTSFWWQHPERDGRPDSTSVRPDEFATEDR